MRNFLALSAAVVGLLAAGPATAQPPAPPRVPSPVAARSDDPFPTTDVMPGPPPVPERRSYQRPPTPDLPGSPPPQDELPITLPEGATLPIPIAVSRDFQFIPRYGTPNQQSSTVLPDGTRRIVFTGGVIVNVNYRQANQQIEFATDNAVAWVRGLGIDRVATGAFSSDPSNKVEVELYLSGNVVIRTLSRQPVSLGTTAAGRAYVTQTVRADEIYYDVDRNRAVAMAADLEMSAPSLPDSAHFGGKEIWRLGPDEWRIKDGVGHASKLPSDPGLLISSPDMTLTERRVIRRNLFGIPYRDIQTGAQIEGVEQILTGRNVKIEVADVPIFYLPYLRTDATDPLGPFVGLGFGQDRIFGTQVYTTWDLYKLLALKGPPGHRWLLHADYLSDRGPAIGTDYSYALLGRGPNGEPAPGYPSTGNGLVKLYGIQDKGLDILGGYRGPEPEQPRNRGRATYRHVQQFDDDWFFQGQVSGISDKNFLEQYFKNEWDLGPNQETFAYLSRNWRNAEGTVLVEPKLGRDWIAETMWLPRADGYLLGQSLFDRFTYNVHGSAGYALARPAENFPNAVLSTDQRIDTGRFDLAQELSLPFALGPVKLVPYATADLTQYTEDLTGNARGRAYGGGGLRTNLPFSHLYADATSDLFNVRGLYHKATLGANYYNARSDTPFTRLPLLDRLNDDATDQAYRNIRLFQNQLVPGPDGQRLMGSPQFDPQRYAIRRLVDTRTDTIDSIQVLQADFRQRLQTKRGYPGQEHVVDVAVLDLSASYFPEQNRDNFGNPFGFLEYDFLWNVGDRTSLVSSGWFEPYETGSRYYTVGAFLDRPDRTNLYVGYRQTDPLRSKAVTAAVGYQMSRKYYTSLSATYDFGIQAALSNTLSLTRTGTDLSFTLGITYNALVNNFGFQFMVIPNLVSAALPGRFGTTGFSR